jgi:hypothetical protein
MANAAPLKATFFAFRKRERSGVLLSATIAFVVMSVVLIGLLVALNFGMLAQLFSGFSAAASGQGSQADGAAIVMGMLGFFFSLFIFLFFFYVLLAAYEAACLRWMIHGEVVGFLGLSLGAPTWRVYSTYWLWFAINMGISTVVSLVTMPFMFMGMAGAAGGGMSDPTVMVGTMMTLQIVATLLQYVIFAFVGIRFAPAAATSITLRKFSFFTAWTVTKGRFWALFGSFVLIGLIYGLVFMVLFVVAGGLVFAQAWPTITSGASADEVMTAIAGLMTPQILAVLAGIYLVMSFVGMIFAVMFYGVNARAALAAVEDGKIPGVTPELANTFS